MSELGEEEEKKEKKKPEQRGTTTGEEELGTGLSNRTRGAPEQRGEEEKESRREGMRRKNPSGKIKEPIAAVRNAGFLISSIAGVINDGN